MKPRRQPPLAPEDETVIARRFDRGSRPVRVGRIQIDGARLSGFDLPGVTGGLSGIRGLKTTTSRFFCSHRQVQPELLFQVSVAPAWKQCSPETVNAFAEEAHAIFCVMPRRAAPCG